VPPNDQVHRTPAAPAELHTLQLGEIRLTYVPDGYYLADPLEQYPSTRKNFWCDHPEVLNAAGELVMSVGAILVESATSVTLIDTGAGPRDVDVAEMTGGAFRGRLVGGQLLDNLKLLAIKPSQVTNVVYTHLHLDHTGWILDGLGHRVFPNATYHVAQEELDLWSTPAMLSTGFGPSERELVALANALGPIGAHTRMELLPTPGHTPGHQSVVVMSSEGCAVILGDAMHCPVELVTDDLGFVTDADEIAAATSRRVLLDRLAQPGHWFAGSHFPTEVFGQIFCGDDGPFLLYPTDVPNGTRGQSPPDEGLADA
jgi:glyoxylase-like metal-dependent hydrolase (beta-lactamase superfamily II)